MLLEYKKCANLIQIRTFRRKQVKNHILFLASILAMCFLSACTSTSTASASRMAVLQNPETKQTVQCKVDPWGSLNFATQVDNCIKAYEKAGYKKVADTADM